MLPLRYGILAKAIRTTIRPEFRVPTDLFLLYARNIQQKYMVFFYVIFLFSTTIRPKIRASIDFFLCARNHSTEI